MSANAAKLAASVGLAGVYPESWDAFVGQENVKRQLIIACRSAKMRGKSLDPILIRGGQPGIGKTTLALLIAAELGGNLHVISGTVRPQEARVTLAMMQEGDVLFYDEVHLAVKGNKDNAAWLLHVLENNAFVGPYGTEELPPISVIGATTDAGKLTRTLLDRFTKVELTGYTESEATAICFNMGAHVFEQTPPPNKEDCEKIARAANCNPRVMRNLLSAVRDVALATNSSNYDGEHYDLAEALSFLGLSEDGLDLLAQRYLCALVSEFPGGAGERMLKERLQEPGGLQHVEHVLVQKGLLMFTGRGRVLTGDGIRRAKALKAEGVAA